MSFRPSVFLRDQTSELFVGHESVVLLSQIPVEWPHCTFEVPPSLAANLTTSSGFFPSGLMKLVVSLLCSGNLPVTCDPHRARCLVSRLHSSTRPNVQIGPLGLLPRGHGPEFYSGELIPELCRCPRPPVSLRYFFCCSKLCRAALRPVVFVLRSPKEVGPGHLRSRRVQQFG